MTQEERWMAHFAKVKAFIEENKRNPSKHDAEERYKYCNWIKHNKKLLNSGELKQERVELFERLLSLCEEYKRVNQYQ